MPSIFPPTPTPTSDRPLFERVRHPLEIRPVHVLQVERIGDHLVHITLEGAALRTLHSLGFDDHIKLLLPPTEQKVHTAFAHPDDGGATSTSDPIRPIARDYTPMHVDLELGRVTLGFALHGTGPAARWAAQAQPGDAVTLGGPKGSMRWATDLDWQWLIGDESALPAIARRLEELPASVRTSVWLHLEHPEGPLPPLALGPGRTLEIVARPRAPTTTGQAASLIEAVARHAAPVGRGLAWVACEHTTALAVRDALLTRCGVPKAQVRASAYWKQGREGHHEKLED